jgi:predicted HTH transcriptional regulator
VLDELVANAVAESRLLDYKEQLPGGGDPDKKEFLADVTSFANSAGGDLVFGIRERRKGGRNTGEAGAVVGLPKVSLDQEILRLDAILRTGMDPRVPGLGLHPVRAGTTRRAW